MIEAIELRIGNWIHLKADTLSGSVNENAKVIELAQDYIKTDISKSYQLPSYEIYGIDITPEILEICKFEKDEDFIRTTYKLGDIYLRDYGSWKLENKIGVPLYHVSIDYLHQLQNLYFALTGTELSIEL